MVLRSKKTIVAGVILVLSVVVWLLGSYIVNKTTPKSQPVKSSKVVKQAKDEYKSITLFRYSKDLKDYSEREEDYVKSVNSFNSYYDLGLEEVDTLDIQSSTSFYVVASSGKSYWVMNPNGSVVGYFSKDFEKSEEFKGYGYYEESVSGYRGVLAGNYAEDIEVDEIKGTTDEMGYRLEEYPVNVELVEDLKDYSPVSDVTLTLGDARFSTKYRLYENTDGNLLLVNQQNFIVGMSPSDGWKAEVFRRGGSGTEVELEGGVLWVY